MRALQIAPGYAQRAVASCCGFRIHETMLQSLHQKERLQDRTGSRLDWIILADLGNQPACFRIEDYSNCVGSPHGMVESVLRLA